MHVWKVYGLVGPQVPCVGDMWRRRRRHRSTSAGRGLARRDYWYLGVRCIWPRHDAVEQWRWTARETSRWGQSALPTNDPSLQQCIGPNCIHLTSTNDRRIAKCKYRPMPNYAISNVQIVLPYRLQHTWSIATCGQYFGKDRIAGADF